MRQELPTPRPAAVLACLLVLSVFFSSVMSAQNSNKTDKSGRKLIYKVDPDYPWDLKRAHIGGVVRIMATVTPRGTIDNISVIGGNPVLVESAVRAVKKWKYAPATTETSVQVNVDFDPNR